MKGGSVSALLASSVSRTACPVRPSSPRTHHPPARPSSLAPRAPARPAHTTSPRAPARPAHTTRPRAPARSPRAPQLARAQSSVTALRTAHAVPVSFGILLSQRSQGRRPRPSRDDSSRGERPARARTVSTGSAAGGAERGTRAPPPAWLQGHSQLSSRVWAPDTACGGAGFLSIPWPLELPPRPLYIPYLEAPIRSP